MLKNKHINPKQSDALLKADLIEFVSGGKKQKVECFGVLRYLEGLRAAYDGCYLGNPAIVKCFYDTFAWFRCFREKRGLLRLLARGVAAPNVLTTGKVDGGRCLIIEKLPDAKSVISCISEAENEQEALRYILKASAFIAKMHKANISQDDMHLGNFLVSNSEIYAIDPGRMYFFGLNNKRRLLLNFAKFLMCIPPRYQKHNEKAIEEYCRQMGFANMQKFLSKIDKAIAEVNRKELKRLSRRVLKPNKRVFLLKRGDFSGIFCKSYFTTTTAAKFLDDFDLIIGNAKSNERLNDSVVYKCSHNGLDYRLRCYQASGGLPGFLLFFIPFRLLGLAFISSARRAWLDGWLKFWKTKNATPPAALLEQRNGFVVKKQWLLEK